MDTDGYTYRRSWIKKTHRNTDRKTKRHINIQTGARRDRKKDTDQDIQKNTQTDGQEDQQVVKLVNITVLNQGFLFQLTCFREMFDVT